MGRISIAGLGPVLEVPMLPDSAPFVVPMPGGGSLLCVLSTSAPAAVAPTLAAADALAGRVWTLTASATGTAPITFGLAFTVNGSAVTLSPTVTGGVHVWTYTAPSSLTPTALAWTVTANNAGGPASASGSRTVPADILGEDVVDVIGTDIVIVSLAPLEPPLDAVVDGTDIIIVEAP